MDERHWWIAGKLQETFRIGGLENPALLEEFLCQTETHDMIDKFLQKNGPCRLFFYSEQLESGSLTSRQLHITGSLTTLKNVDLREVAIVYFLRSNCDTDVDAGNIEKEIICGELKGNCLDSLTNMLSDLYIPLIKVQRNWGKCDKENKAALVFNLEKTLSSMTDINPSSASYKHAMLKKPENMIGIDFKQQRVAALDPHIIAEYETLVNDWINTIENILQDTSDERFMDPNSGPMSELERWKRRLRLLTSLTEQLKSKECKGVIGVLIAAKSKLLKKWKVVDTGITDAMNETKDKVRYLEGLKRYFEQLYGTGASPTLIMSTALPGIVNTVKQMDSISRFYARQGFLGLLFTKVTNQIVIACKEYIQGFTVTETGEDLLWDKIKDEIVQKDPSGSVDPHHSHMKEQLDRKLKNFQGKNLKRAPHDQQANKQDDSLLARIKSCLTLQSVYRDTLRSLKDALGASHNMSHFTSMSSLGPVPATRSKLPSGSGNIHSTLGPKSRNASLSMSHSKRGGGSVAEDGHGVSVADEDTILAHLDSFCSRLRQVLDVIHTLTQFTRLSSSSAALPRPKMDDLVCDEGIEEDDKQTEEKDLSPRSLLQHHKEEMDAEQKNNLVVIVEDAEEGEDGGDPGQGGRHPEVAESSSEEEVDGKHHRVHDLLYPTHSAITRKEIDLIRHYYPEDQKDDGPSVSSIIHDLLAAMVRVLADNINTRTMLDVESQERDRFEEAYTSYLVTVQDMERFLAAYLHAIFVRKTKTNEALELATRFIPIQQRSGVKSIINEKFVEIFGWYEEELEEIQQNYEKHKEEPPKMRNAPPVAGAISWSRQLLKRIEEPMKVFRDSKGVTGMKGFSRVVRLYNRLATALVTFESLWFTHWKAHIDHARNGLRATLLVLHPDTKDIVVNADEKVLELIHESKCLVRLGIQIPDTAQQILMQENRFKSYRDHLALCLREYGAVCDSVPDTLRPLFQPHIDQALQNFQPGLHTLAWNSMNIDAFLHQIHTGTSNLRFLVERVNDIKNSKVKDTIDRVRDMIFFDYKLAFSKSWPPSEFTSLMVESVKTKGEQLYNHLQTIENGVRDIALSLTGKAGRSAQLEQGSHAVEPVGRSMSKGQARIEDKVINALLESFHDEIYEAILLATTRSLVTLAESCGCSGEAIRAASVLSEAPSGVRDPRGERTSGCGGGSGSGRPLSSCPGSRATSATVAGDRSRPPSRPPSILSMLSNMSWTSDVTREVTYLQFEVEVKFSIPNIVVEPPLDCVQTAVDALAKDIMAVPAGLTWCGQSRLGQQLTAMVQEDEVVDEILSQLASVVEDLQAVIQQHVVHIGCYDFLWKDDLHGNYYDFVRHDPGLAAINREVEHLLGVERKVLAIPPVLRAGPVCLHTDPVRDALHGLAMAWKNQYALILHEEAKKKLDAAVLYRSNVRQRLELSVANLDQLNSTLTLLEELRDMENKVDDIYLPIETMYAKLKVFELRLARHEVHQVEELRDRWQELLELAHAVEELLLKERRANFQQELDKQIKTFVVEVIQFRNSFDAQGPAVPDIPSSEAVTRLHDFQQRYALYDSKRRTLDSVSKLFSIPCKPFPELDKTGEELELLGLLYGLFQKFIRFNDRFRYTLWAEVDLDSATREVESYWDECLALPSKLKDWDAYNDMKDSLQTYRDVFPLLHQLASREIRNRHWLQVMSVTGSTFQLEANVFRLQHLLDIGLIQHREKIQEICTSANRELELEVKLRMTEEEWTEQVLTLEPYKRRGPIYLEKVSTERFLEQLEDAQALLAQMLTSRYIGPLRDEAASWAEKLKEVAQVLEQWLEVQDLWQYLEAVFNNPDTAKELPQEAKRFQRIDKGWTKLMKRAFDTRNVLQCCYGEDVPKGVVLRHIHQELEICFKSLVGYLDNKRRLFPRFFFVSDPVLLAILSKPNDLVSVRPHLRSLFSGIHDVCLEQQHQPDSDDEGGEDKRRSAALARSRLAAGSPFIQSAIPANKIDKRLAHVHIKSPQPDESDAASGDTRPARSRQATRRSTVNHSTMSQYPSVTLPSELLREEAPALDAYAVTSSQGEVVTLNDKVSLSDGVEQWLDRLRQSLAEAIQTQLIGITEDVRSGVACEEWTYKYCTQVCRLGLLYYWTRECELAVAELKYDRKALAGLSRRFATFVTKLPSLLGRGAYRAVEEPLQPKHRLRIENMITQSSFLRDTIDNLGTRKLRESTDFEWRRNLRLYVRQEDGKPCPRFYVLEQPYTYGCEFYGAPPVAGQTSTTDKCFLSMCQAMSQGQGAMLSGQPGVGKTETIKAFGHTMGRFLVLFQCAANSNSTSLGKVLQGLAMDGSWGCFDDVHLLNDAGRSVLIDHTAAILGAVKAKQEYCYLGDGQQIPVQRNVSVFMTSSGGPHDLPAHLRAMFRQVALVQPSLSLVLKAKCSRLGLKAPSVLALRLKLIAELAKDQLPDTVQYEFSTAALTGVLERAAQRRRTLKEVDRSGERTDKRLPEGADGSRSNSVLSTAASSFPVQQHSSGSIGPPGSVKGTTPGERGGRKTGSPNTMTAAAKAEHVIVAQTLLDVIGPRLAQQHLPVFKAMVKDLFSGLPDPAASSHGGLLSAVSRSYDMEAALDTVAQQAGLVPQKAWRDKCMQLYNVAQVHQGILVVGGPGTGKSSVIRSVVEALCVVPRGGSRGTSRGSTRSRLTMASTETTHKLQRVFPLVTDDVSDVFGHVTASHDWVDGVLTSTWRKASRVSHRKNQSTAWLCMDGPLNASWADHFTSVLDAGKTLTLSNGDQLFLSSNIKLVFETDDLSSASPGVVARSGVVFVDKNVVGWRPVAKAWLENRSRQEVHVLQRAFDKTVDVLSNFVTSECKSKVPLSEVGLFQTTLLLLSAMLADNIELGGELHVERLYLFCLMWTFGGLLNEKDRRAFNDLLATLSTALPDDDRHICFFDYYVDESGEWDPWTARVPETVFTEHTDPLGEVFIDTVDTIRTRMLMEFACSSGQNVLLTGPPGSGKTSMINDFLDTQDSASHVAKRLVYSRSSSAQQLHNFMSSNIYHRQGYVYGAKDNKKLQLFIDDLNLPGYDDHGVQRCNELLRRLLDEGVLCTQERPFECRSVEGLSVLGAVNLSDSASVTDRVLSPRLLRHFAVLHLPYPEDDAMKTVVHGILEGNMLYGDHPGLDMDLHGALVGASCRLLADVRQVLRPSVTPGRAHYLFTLKDIVTCFQCLKRLADESREDDHVVVSLWRHEMLRIMRDRLCRHSDSMWFDDKMAEIIRETWPDLEENMVETFVTFPVEARVFNRPVTTVSKKEVKVMLRPMENPMVTHSCLQTHLNRYNEDFGNVYLNILLSDNIVAHIIKMHRVLSYHHSGNFVLVGPVGSNLSTLIRLALHVAHIPIHPVDCSKPNNFYDGLRSAVRLTGAEGKTLTVFFTGRDLEEPGYLDAINSLLVSGEYPYLFTNDELDGLLQAIAPIMKRARATVSPHKFFVSRVRTNLHIAICLPPQHNLVRQALRDYPGLLSGSQFIWLCDWTKEALLAEATYYLDKFNLTNDCEDDLSDAVIASLANIHSYVLSECRQTKWAGDAGEEVTMTQVKVTEKKKEQIKTTHIQMPNRPYSKAIVIENIKYRRKMAMAPSCSELFVGPLTYRRFMAAFRTIYTQKAAHRTEMVEKLKNVLQTLSRTRKDAKNTKDSIRSLTRAFEEARERTAGLLLELMGRATELEKLKAQAGMATSLSAFLQLNDLSDEEDEDDRLLNDEERDEYDAEFERMREANLKTRQVQAREELEGCQATVDSCRAQLAYAKQQVLHWKGRVDRSCIERLKAFQNPTMLVGQVVEMVMTLIGKRLLSQRPEPRDYPAREEQSGRMSASSSSTKMTMTTGGRRPKLSNKDSNERFDRATWKAMQLTMTDSVKFVDILHNVPWEDGLEKDILSAVEGYLACGKDGRLGVTGEGTMLENASEKEKGLVATRQPTSPTEGARGITISAAKYSSEDAGTLVNYTIAIVEYSRLCGPLRAAMERVHELQREIDENARIQQEKERQITEDENEQAEDDAAGPAVLACEILTEADLPRVQQEVNDLQERFDRAVEEKHRLQQELESTKERLLAGSAVIDSLKAQEDKWRQLAEDHCSNDVLVANSICAAAFLTYCSGMNKDSRQAMGDFFQTVCEHNELPMPAKRLFKNLGVFDFFYNQMEVCELETRGLPTSATMLENTTFLQQSDNLTVWPLVSDSTSAAIDWLANFLGGRGLVHVKYSELRSQFDSCLSDGLPLLITHLDMAVFMRDPRFHDILYNRHKFTPGQNRFKMRVGDHEVESDPGFRMFLHTTTAPHCVPPEVAAHLAVIAFQQTRQDVEDRLLNRFLRLEKGRLHEEKASLLQDRYDNLRRLDSLEQQMVAILSSDLRLLNDLVNTKRLADLKKQFDETLESQQRVEAGEAGIEKAKAGFRVIAQRGAVCFDTTRYMAEIRPLYHTSFQHFLRLFDMAISHSDRAAVKAVVERLTQIAYVGMMRSLTDQDCFIYQLFLALEMEDSVGRVGRGEREFLISPSLGSVTMTSLERVQPPDSKVAQAKKPFDWMSDDQFNNLHLLALHYDWFLEVFERMPRDGRETQWRALCESDQPELQAMPDRAEDAFTQLQKMCVVRAVRADRLMQVASHFITQVLGKKLCGESYSDLGAVVKQSEPTTPILVLYTIEPLLAEKQVRELAQRRQTAVRSLQLAGSDPGSDKLLRIYLKKATQEGSWLLVLNGCGTPHHVTTIESYLQDAEGVDPQFRCWVTGATTDPIPICTLQNCFKVMVDTPKGIKDGLMRALGGLEPAVLRQSPKPEWPVVLHNMAFVQGALRLKARFGQTGWNHPADFIHTDSSALSAGIQFALEEFQDNLTCRLHEDQPLPRTTSWAGLRFMLAEILFGNLVTDANDQLALNALIDYWISPAAIKKDFELAKLKYKLPACFFNPNVRLAQLVQSLDNMSPYLLECPEACSMHNSPESLLGDEQYVFTRLNKVLDAMPSTASLAHKLFPRPPSPVDALDVQEVGWSDVITASPLQKLAVVKENDVVNATALGRPPLANISSQSNNPLVVDRGVFASASAATLRMKKEVELWEVCYTMLPKVPKSYSKDVIQERIKKIGGATSFNLFIMKEVEMMYQLVIEIKTSLLAIKAACELEVMGDQLSSHQLQIADDLYHLRVPRYWCHLAGKTAPPINQPLATWLVELQNRCQHFDKILAQGREKMPAYWLGAFFYPRGVMALLRQDCYRHYLQERGGALEPFVFQTEITGRDKDHIRDPPAEGIFVFGIYLWGCAWEKTSAELVDLPPRNTCAALPVVHLTCWPQAEKPLLQDTARAGEVYQCPIYHSRGAPREPVMELDLYHSGIPAQRWALRGLSATIRPF